MTAPADHSLIEYAALLTEEMLLKGDMYAVRQLRHLSHV